MTVPQRILAIFALPALAVFVLFVVLGFFWWPFFIVALPAAALVVYLMHRRADQAILGRLDARNLGEIEGERLRNTVESLSLQSGIDQPDLYVVESNAINLGALHGSRSSLVVTCLLYTSDAADE